MFIKNCKRRGEHLLFAIISLQYSPGGLGNRTRVRSHLFGTGRQRPPQPWSHSVCPLPSQTYIPSEACGVQHPHGIAMAALGGRGRLPALLIPSLWVSPMGMTFKGEWAKWRYPSTSGSLASSGGTGGKGQDDGTTPSLTPPPH